MWLFGKNTFSHSWLILAFYNFFDKSLANIQYFFMTDMVKADTDMAKYIGQQTYRSISKFYRFLSIT